MIKLLKKIIKFLNPLSGYRALKEENRFILYELQRINETMRYQTYSEAIMLETDAVQTRSSFDFQWNKIPESFAMTHNEDLALIQNDICRFTDKPAAWFAGKRVADIGCGEGRFSYGLLSLGAIVDSFDQSEWALKRVRKLCQPFDDRLNTEQKNLLTWDEELEYDLVFCFGVVHHTGNTYLAMRNVARKVKLGGDLFLMVYGFPVNSVDFFELTSYEKLRHELRNHSFDERKNILEHRFGPQAHGWFDAVSPRINDLLSYNEIEEFLGNFGFENIHPTVKTRNHHIAARKGIPKSV